MSQRANTARRSARKQYPLKLEGDLSIELRAFSEAHYGAPQNKLIDTALRRFLQQELSQESPEFLARFEAAKRRLQGRQVTPAATKLAVLRPRVGETEGEEKA